MGDALLLYNGTTVVVATVDFRVGRERVYNFAVAQNANYFVGMSGVGVHNCKNAGRYRPNRELPQDKHGNSIPDADIPHTQLGTGKGRKGDYTHAREWGYDENGNLVKKRDIDFTDHGRPQEHPNPHQHDWLPNSTGGTLKHGPAKPLEWP